MESHVVQSTPCSQEVYNDDRMRNNLSSHITLKVCDSPCGRTSSFGRSPARSNHENVYMNMKSQSMPKAL
eukprot:2192720-Amphidinium_carterae.1